MRCVCCVAVERRRRRHALPPLDLQGAGFVALAAAWHQAQREAAAKNFERNVEELVRASQSRSRLASLCESVSAFRLAPQLRGSSLNCLHVNGWLSQSPARHRGQLCGREPSACESALVAFRKRGRTPTAVA